MVLLTMTASMIEALEKLRGLGRVDEKEELYHDDTTTEGIINNDEKRADQRTENATMELVEKESKPSIPGNISAELGKRMEGTKSTEPNLLNPRIGNPISHGQVIDLSKDMKARGLHPYRLEDLLKAARVYVAPPPPKPEPVRIHAFVQLHWRGRSWKENQVFSSLGGIAADTTAFFLHSC